MGDAPARSATGVARAGFLRDHGHSEEREVFEIVRRAQQAAFEAVRSGIACQEIDRVARRVISDAGYGENFIHRTGHRIGLSTLRSLVCRADEKRLDLLGAIIVWDDVW
jgi:Xaa-Pro aminopeptidase